MLVDQEIPEAVSAFLAEESSVPVRPPEEVVVMNSLYVGIVGNQDLRTLAERRGIPMQDLIDHGDAHTGDPEVGIMQVYDLGGPNIAFRVIREAKRFITSSDLNGLKRPALERLNVLHQKVVGAEQVKRMLAKP